MYSILQSQSLMSTIKRELPSAAAAMLIAEPLYKFHSFILECLAFLFTWYALSSVWNKVLFCKRRDTSS
jgi:hypothetical protein